MGAESIYRAMRDLHSIKDAEALNILPTEEDIEDWFRNGKVVVV